MSAPLWVWSVVRLCDTSQTCTPQKDDEPDQLLPLCCLSFALVGSGSRCGSERNAFNLELAVARVVPSSSAASRPGIP